ncbi:unnamed protein product, partial [Brassica rapa]
IFSHIDISCRYLLAPKESIPERKSHGRVRDAAAQGAGETIR